MANTISILNFNNTFSDWVARTNSLIRENNDFAANNYIKPTGTFFLNDPSLGLQVASTAIFGGQLQVQGINSSALIQNNLRVDGQVYFSNTILGLTNAGQANIGGPILALGANNGIIVSNSAIVGANLNVVNTISTSNLYANNIVTSNIIVANTSTFANSITSRVANIGDLFVTGQFLVSGGISFTGSPSYDGNQLTLSGGFPSGVNSYLVVNRGSSGANATIRWNEANTYFDILNLTDSKYYRILTSDLLSTSFTSNSNTSIATSWVANTLNNRIFTANSFLQSNVGSALANAKSYTDTANTYIKNRISLVEANVANINIAFVSYTDTANLWLQSNVGNALANSKAYTDAANTYHTAFASNANNITTGTINILRLPVATGVVPNRYGTSANIPSVTIDSYGRVTAIANVTVNIPSGTINLAGDSGSGSVTTGTTTLVLSSANTQIASFSVSSNNYTFTPQGSGVTPGTYTISTITVDQYGRVTGASSGTIAGVNITNDTTTSTTLYPLMTVSTSGSLSTVNTSSSKITYTPSTGQLNANNFAINGNRFIGSQRELVGFRETCTTVGSVGAATYNLDMNLGNVFDVTLGTNVTFTFTNVPTSGIAAYATVIVRQPSASPGKTAAFTNAKWTDAVAPTWSTTANAIDVVSFMTVNGGTMWMGSFVLGNVS